MTIVQNGCIAPFFFFLYAPSTSQGAVKGAERETLTLDSHIERTALRPDMCLWPEGGSMLGYGPVTPPPASPFSWT